MFTHITSVLPALHIGDTVSFYQQQLGFSISHQEEEYGIVKRDQVEIHFWKCSDKNIAENSSCRITTTNIEKIYADCKARSLLHPNADLELKPWGNKEFAIVDLNGNLVWFIQPVSRTD